MTGLPHHPYAARFPMLGAAELAELAESIKANGLRHPIVLDTEGQILDGRNRDEACRIAGVEPDFTTYDGDDLAEFVIDANSSRRHMSTGARAMSTALVLADDGRRKDGKWSYGAVPNSQKSDRSSAWRVAMANAGTVLDHAPDLAAEVVAGDLALDAAYRRAVAVRDDAERRAEEEARLAAEEAEAEDFITEHDPDLAAQVGDGKPFQTYAEALTIWNQRNREEADRRRQEKVEAERRQREYDDAMSDLYTGIAKAVQTVATYGGYADIGDLWEKYEPRHLDPPQLIDVFTPESLAEARRLIDWLDNWNKEQA